MDFSLVSHRRNQLIVFLVLLALGAGVFLMAICVAPGLKSCAEKKPAPLPPLTLNIWNVFEEREVYAPFIDKFKAEHPNVDIVYRNVPFAGYEAELLSALNAGTGPDIFALHNTWLPKFKKHAVPIPEDLLNFSEVREKFPDVVQFDFVDEANGAPRLFAVPLFLDTLALFYNRAYFKNAEIVNPPKTWNEFAEDVKKLRTKNAADKIDLAGAAIGTAYNVNRAADVLSLLMMQSGANMADRAKKRAAFADTVLQNGFSFEPGAQALEFYTSFADPSSDFYTWNDAMPNSVDAFAEGNAAMIFGYAYLIPVLEGKNRYLDFAVAPMPQPADIEDPIAYANYWGFAVSSSPRERTAWEFVRFLAREENSHAYLEKVRRPAAQKALIFTQDGDPLLRPFAAETLKARSWYEGDNGAVEEMMAQMIDNVVKGKKTVSEALAEAAQKITNVLARY